MTGQAWIERLQLQPHPEGGWYRETYRSDGLIVGLDRCHATAIYFLLCRGEVSHFHRLRSDELWFHHDGGVLQVHALDPASGGHTRWDVGPGDSAARQIVIPRGYWFAAEPAPDCDYALVSCVVAPGFDFRDFEMGRRAALNGEFPSQRSVIARLALP